MPRCNTCSAVVSKDDILLDEGEDRTRCTMCSDSDNAYKFQLTVTSSGIGVGGVTPYGSLEFSMPWSDVRKQPELASVSALPVAKEG
jgi:hypothetical protein